MKMPPTWWKSRSCQAAWHTARPGPRPSARLRPPSACGSRRPRKTASKFPSHAGVWSMPDHYPAFDIRSSDVRHFGFILLAAPTPVPRLAEDLTRRPVRPPVQFDPESSLSVICLKPFNLFPILFGCQNSADCSILSDPIYDVI